MFVAKSSWGLSHSFEGSFRLSLNRVLTGVDACATPRRSPPMSPSNDVQSPRRNHLVQTGRAVLGASVFAGGLLVAGVFSSAVPAAPQDCLPPPVGCVTTS